MHVVVIDDQERLVELVTSYLEESGISASGRYDGLSGLAAVNEETPDAVVLDLMLPELNGTAVCKALRAAGNDVPVLMLTARGEVRDRVAGLEAGADDYLVKPFAMEELVARLHAIVRRREVAAPETLEAGDVHLDPSTRLVSVAGISLELPRREFAVLSTLMDPPGRAVSRGRLFDEVYDGEIDVQSNALEVHISRLRSHLAGSATTSITTLRGIGYRLDVAT